MSKFKDNIPGFPGYHVTKNGDVCVKYLRDLGYSWKDIRIALHLSRVAIEKYKKP